MHLYKSWIHRLAMLMFVAFPLAGYAAIAAKIDFSSGSVVAIAPDGSQRALVKGADVNSGDTVQTASAGRVQLRFTDGGYVSLQPNTNFRVDQYQYEGQTDGTEKGYFSLIKGAMRAVTGAIGHVNKKNYLVNTPVATIGIRGTEFVAQMGDKLLIKVGDGAIYITNQGGDLVLFRGEAAEVRDAFTKPQQTNEQPSVTSSGPQGGSAKQTQDQQNTVTPTTFSTGDDRTSTGQSCSLTSSCGPAATILNGQAVIVAHDNGVFEATSDCPIGSSCYAKVSVGYPAGVVLNSSGAAMLVDNSVNQLNGNSFVAAQGTTSIAEFGSYGALGWTRWENGYVVVNDSSGLSDQYQVDVHSMYGTSTNSSEIGQLMNAYSGYGTVATYDLVGGTHPTDSAGQIGTLTDGALVAYFTPQDPYVYTVLDLSIAGGKYVISESSALISRDGSSPVTSNNVMPYFKPSSGYGYCTGMCPNGPSSSKVAIGGFFSGPSAAQAGVVYFIQGTNTNTAHGAVGDISGVAAFNKVLSGKASGCGYSC